MTTLAAAITECRAAILATEGSKARVCVLWTHCKAARSIESADKVRDAFVALGDELLLNRHGYWPDDVYWRNRYAGRMDVRHTVDWALRGKNPLA